jgi:hypothetical protein
MSYEFLSFWLFTAACFYSAGWICRGFWVRSSQVEDSGPDQDTDDDRPECVRHITRPRGVDQTLRSRRKS